jgi:hypothetical protein
MAVDPNKIRALVRKIPKTAPKVPAGGAIGGLVGLAALALGAWGISSSLYNGRTSVFYLFKNSLCATPTFATDGGLWAFRAFLFLFLLMEVLYWSS